MTGLAARLALSFGNIPSMSALYSDDLVWTLPPSLGVLSGPFVGREAVLAFNEGINRAYEPTSMRVEILDDIDMGNLSAARFKFSATMLPSGEPWQGEYSMFVRARDGKIIEVHERLDTLAVARVRNLI
jgi:ketosteroid isomerase-like protein